MYDLSDSNSVDPTWPDAPVFPDVDPGVTSWGEDAPNWNATSGFVRSAIPRMLEPPFVVGAFRDLLVLAVTTPSATPTVKEGSRGAEGAFPMLSSTTLTTNSGLGTDVFIPCSVACGRMRPKSSCWLDELVDKAAATSR